MRKLLLFACAMFVALAGYADSFYVGYLELLKSSSKFNETSTATQQLKNFNPLSYNGFEFNFTAGTYRKASGYMSCIAGAQLSIEAPEDGTMSKVVIGLSSKNVNKGVTTDNGTCDVTDTQIIWTGNASKVTFTFSIAMYLDNFEVTYVAELPVSAMPVFDPVPGTYPGPMEVTILPAEGTNSTIYYTVDGSTPTVDPAMLYTGPVTLQPSALGNDRVVKAIAVEDGKDPSTVAVGTYTVVEGVKVTTIHNYLYDNEHDYNTIGVDKSTLFTFTGKYTVVYQNGPTLFIQDATGGLQLTGNIGRTYQPGDVISGFSGFFQSLKFGTPALNPVVASFGEPVSQGVFTWNEGTANDVIASNANDGFLFKSIYMSAADVESPEFFRSARTLDGGQFTLYNGFSNTSAYNPIFTFPAEDGYYDLYGFVGQETSGGADGTSEVVFMPVLMEKVDAPVSDAPSFETEAGTYPDEVNVAITAAPGASIYYTLDGSYPTAESTLYTEPFTLTETTTVKAVAIAPNRLPSEMVEAEFVIVITPTTEAPVFTPEGGKYEDSVEVTITAAEGAKVYYTLDGTEPTEESTLYTAPFTLTETTTVMAIAVAEGELHSEIAEAAYEIVKKDGIDTITVAGNEAAELFDLQGRRIDATRALPGLYLRRQGTETVKVIIK
ncbi:MAG: hypothetical protein HDS92_02960 [Bacteroidales bacterium]|nr:hypothetical protein [Bacteroidales bacterium]